MQNISVASIYTPVYPETEPKRIAGANRAYALPAESRINNNEESTSAPHIKSEIKHTKRKAASKVKTSSLLSTLFNIESQLDDTVDLIDTLTHLLEGDPNLLEKKRKKIIETLARIRMMHEDTPLKNHSMENQRIFGGNYDLFSNHCTLGDLIEKTTRAETTEYSEEATENNLMNLETNVGKLVNETLDTLIDTPVSVLMSGLPEEFREKISATGKNLEKLKNEIAIFRSENPIEIDEENLLSPIKAEQLAKEFSNNPDDLKTANSRLSPSTARSLLAE